MNGIDFVAPKVFFAKLELHLYIALEFHCGKFTYLTRKYFSLLLAVVLGVVGVFPSDLGGGVVLGVVGVFLSDLGGGSGVSQ